MASATSALGRRFTCVIHRTGRAFHGSLVFRSPRTSCMIDAPRKPVFHEESIPPPATVRTRRQFVMSQAKARTRDATREFAHTEATAELLRELVAHLREKRTELREEWARRITEARLLTAMS